MEEQVTTIANQMTAHVMKMESIILRGKLSQDANKGIMDENDRLLNIFSKETSTRLSYVENPISLFGALRKRNITPVTVFRGNLEFSPKLSIKVMVYKKTAEEKFPSRKKYSDKAPPNDKFAKHKPNGQQLEAAANLIKTLDLAPHGQEEVLLPDLTPNPVLELKSKDPDVAVPPLDDTLKKVTEPDADLLLPIKSVIDSFRRSLELKGNPLARVKITAQPANLVGKSSVKVETIGDLTPVQDFEALISRRDSPD
ncbi:hypothetical protein JHK85_001822 [Glycine max]|nr:hypothetical protein JHK85_001822 [Glycine max]